jgi:hypothetical protein
MIMSERLTWAEIEERYPQEHVELVDYDWPEDEINPRSGVVVSHAKTLKDLVALTKNSPTNDAAVLFVGTIKPPPGTILSCNLVRITAC